MTEDIKPNLAGAQDTADRTLEFAVSIKDEHPEIATVLISAAETIVLVCDIAKTLWDARQEC